jgi:hypothetical protein
MTEPERNDAPRMPGDKLPTYEEMAERLDKLEQRAGKIKLNDLPMAPLKNKLEQDWRPSASVLLGAASITTEMLVDGTITETDHAPVEASIVVGSGGTAPAFTNSWVAWAVGSEVTFYKERGRVYLDGIAKTGAAGTSVFTLPVGYRPTWDAPDFIILAGPSAQYAYVSVSTAGLVIPFNIGTSSVSTFTFFSGISFRAA